MEIHYISHACLFCQVGDLRLIMDPWFEGPAYLEQWHVDPVPASAAPLQEAGVIVISHGHEDHLHVPTLRRCDRHSSVLHPLQLSASTRRLFQQELGFPAFRELPGHRGIRLEGGARLSFVPVGHDAILVLEANGEVLVNVNDALHSAPLELIEDVTAFLSRRFPDIDVLFCGFGGASSHPNCVHAEWKDDVEIARLRECYFARNFCVITQALQPRVAVPFAADFALQHEPLRWIDRNRFDRARMGELYEELFGATGGRTQVLPMRPGQVLESGVLGESRFGRPRPSTSDLPRPVPESSAAEVIGPYARRIEKNQRRAGGRPFRFSVHLHGSDGVRSLRGETGRGAPRVRIGEQDQDPADLRCDLPAAHAAHVLKSPWHSDVLRIGYGYQMKLRTREVARGGAVDVMEDLLTHDESLWRGALAHPLRALSCGLTNHKTRSALGRRLRPRPLRTNLADVPRETWLLESPADLARQLGLPADRERFFRSWPRG